MEGIGCVGVRVCRVKAPSTTQISGGSSSFIKKIWIEESGIGTFIIATIVQKSLFLLFYGGKVDYGVIKDKNLE